jgi:hypothetical protein
LRAASKRLPRIHATGCEYTHFGRNSGSS